jgi:NAD-dependent dihydropyrimidine dehydrogenase PreA subunit
VIFGAFVPRFPFFRAPPAQCTYDKTGKISGYQRATAEDKNLCIWINQADCIRCGACIDVCPDDAVSLQKVSLRMVMTAKA